MYNIQNPILKILISITITLFLLNACQKSINSESTIPDLSTNSINSVTANSAICSCEINSDGESEIIERGICWSTNSNSTKGDNVVINNSDESNYSCALQNLTPETTYYVRAFATNEIGTGYGNEISFTTLSSVDNTITDIDGNVYNTIVIGDQTWMVENLKTTRFNDGSSITNASSSEQWSNLSSPAYVWYNNDISNKPDYGALYNAYAIETGRLAPIGWRVATNSDWNTLVTFLGGQDIAGGKLKESGTDHWASPNRGATNESGFTALPGGYRFPDGTFATLGIAGIWLTSTNLNASNNYAWHLDYDYEWIYNIANGHNQGASVRCIME